MSILLGVAFGIFALPPAHANNTFGGVNLSGAEFGTALPGTLGEDYIWPTTQEIDYFHDRGMNILRIPFLWERMQHAPYGTLDPTYLAALDGLVAHAGAVGMRVILDPQNFARYYGELIGSADVPDAAFADFWSRLAAHYAASPQVIFGLMNEPNSMPTEQWVDAANAAIAAIRASGAPQWIFVPGNAWTGAHSWSEDWYGTPNSVAMLSIVDSANHFVFELHQYFDANYGGESETCLSAAGTGANELQGVTGWLREHGYKGFLAELAGANNATCHTDVDNALTYLKSNADVWLGWSWWSAGPWWDDYMFTLEPSGNFSVDAPQMAWLAPYMPPIFADGFDGG